MNWRKIKAEYIAGGISQRALSEKYGVPFGTLQKQARLKKWGEARKAAESKAVEKVSDKTAEIVADNAVLLEEIKTDILLKLKKAVNAYEMDATEYKTVKKTKDKKAAILTFKMRDLAAVYEALSNKADKPGQCADVEDLAPLAELLKDE